MADVMDLSESIVLEGLDIGQIVVCDKDVPRSCPRSDTNLLY